MNSTVINIKTDQAIKTEAQKIASDLGLSLSGVINGFLKQLVRDKTIMFTLNENNPSPYLLNSIKTAKQNKKSGDFYSFKNNKEALSFIDDKKWKLSILKNFIKDFKCCPEYIKSKFKSRLEIFIQDQNDLILNNHALLGELKGYRSINITGDWRAIFEDINNGEVAYFVAIGTHSQLYS